MLGNKAKPRRLNSKGDLRIHFGEYRFDTKSTKVSRALFNSIPVLSIFALMGIIAFSVMLPSNDLTRLFSMDKLFGLDGLLEDSNKAYAEEGITPLADTSASLTVDDGKIKDTIFAANGEFAYASHKITLEANNIKSYSLTLSKTAGLTGPSTIDGANGKTPDQMDNAWGYAFINDGTDPTSANYQTLASSNTLSGPAIDSNHNLSGSKQLVFGAKFGSSAMSGTYHAEATLSLVATPYTVVNYSLTYNANNGTNAPTTQTYADDTGAASHTFTISSTIPTRSGYKFLGWAESSTATTAQYAANGSITLPATAPAKTIYAVWQQVLTIKTITNMQQMTKDVCAASATGDTNTLTDTRDNSTYTVAKLSDGNCWMTQNLRLAGNKTINSTNSDLNGISSYTLPASTTSGFNSNLTGGSYQNQQMRNASDNNYGAYYSWCAATAGTCIVNSTPIAANNDAPSSICPKGWKLPKNGEYGTLKTKYSGAWTTNNSKNGRWLGAANTAGGGAFFPAAGQITKTALAETTTHGYYWTRTANSTDKAYRLYFRSDYVDGAHSYETSYLGYSVRCVAYSS